jgi:hypothetical protein
VYGTGGRMRAFFNEFGEETDFDARVSVFRGSCSSLECVEQDDSLRWNSTAGELYSMLVYGADGSSGDFGLFVDLGNEVCTDVVNPLPTNETILGGAVIGIGPMDTGLVAWFPVVGTGATMLFSSCFVFPGFSFAVYSGSCGNLTSVEGVEEGIEEGIDTGTFGYGYTGGGYGYESGGYGNGFGYDDDVASDNYGFGYGYGDELFCPLFVSWDSIKDEAYYIRAEARARYNGTNLVDYLFRVAEKSP